MLASSTFVKHRRVVIFLAVLAILVPVIVIYQLVIIGRVHSQRAERDFNREVGPVNRLIASYGIVSRGDPESVCSNRDKDESVRINCVAKQFSERPVDRKFISEWPAHAQELETTLTQSGWQKQSNFDPVTKNAINSLPDLFKYQGTYAADVTYVKDTCTLRFDVSPGASDAILASLRTTASCSSVARSWYSL